MDNPIFWLGLSVGLVAAGLFTVVVTMIPAVIQLGRAAKSVERFFDTLLQELPPTLEAIRLTTLEVSEIADSVDDGVKGAGQVVQQVNRSLEGARTQAKGAQVNAQSVWAGVRAAWQTFLVTSGTDDNPTLSEGSPSPSALPRGRQARLTRDPLQTQIPGNGVRDGEISRKNLQG